MKKTISLITAGLAVVCIGAFLLIHHEVTDRFNPLVKKACMSKSTKTEST